MKLILLTLQILICTSVFANTSNANDPAKPVLRTFYSRFPEAKQVSWQVKRDMVVATFLNKDEVAYAYYSPDGNFLAVSRTIQVSQLPMLAADNLNKEIGKKSLVNVFEVYMHGESNYFATLKDEKSTTIITANSSGIWNHYKKTRS